MTADLMPILCQYNQLISVWVYFLILFICNTVLHLIDAVVNFFLTFLRFCQPMKYLGSYNSTYHATACLALGHVIKLTFNPLIQKPMYLSCNPSQSYGVSPVMGSHSVIHCIVTSARQAGTQFTYPWGMEGWVDLGDWLYTEMVYLSADSHTSR